MNRHKPQDAPTGRGITRRKILTAGGATLVGATLLGPLMETALGQALGGRQMRLRGITAKEGGTKPTFLPEAGSNDPVAHSIAENLFWNEQMLEHARFFVMLMPGPELAAARAQAEQFQQTFAGQLERARTSNLDRGNYAAFNRATVELVKPYSDFKRKMRDEQAAGRLQSLVWPAFFEHTGREADRFAKRLDQFSRGDTSTDMKEAAEFWTIIMGEHADFIAHLLDPEESTLIRKAMETSDAFRRMHKSVPSSKGPVEKAVDDIIDFKTAAEKGIQTGKIKSIIHPALADHVRREALKAADELRRAA
ncbi:MAG TPA: DUF2935 domain-containing protein [Pyrinomonadaceae bacterium]|nr:DUF2935 domain-containing protein [Pyrinomonadaceae bacterium]